VPVASDVVVMERGSGAIFRVRVAVAVSAGMEKSFTWTLKLVPDPLLAVVGVPLSIPVAPSVSPAGALLPEAIDQR